MALGPLGILLTLAPSAWATTYVAMDDRDLVGRSEVIVQGRVVAVEAAPGELPAVDYQVLVDRWLKGALPATDLIVRVPGGVRSDGLGLRIRGMPVYRPGDEGVFFLTRRADGAFGLYQYFLGAFHVVAAGGERYAVRDLGDADELVVPGRSRPRDGARHLDDFATWIEDRVAGRPAGRVRGYFAQHVPRFALITSLADPPPIGCGDLGGHMVRWTSFDAGIPALWRIHENGQPGLEGGGSFELRAALRAWNSDPHTAIDIFFAGTTTATSGLLAPDGVNAVIFDDPNDEIGGSFLDSGVLAMGGPWFECRLEPRGKIDFHPIVEADIVTQDGLAAFFERLSERPSEAAQELFAHELGHTLGLDHSEMPEALMNALIHDDGRAASLDVDDFGAIFVLYGSTLEPLAAPGRPYDVELFAEDHQTVRVFWKKADILASNYRVERRPGVDGSEYRLVGTAPSEATSFLDIGLEPETYYVYRVVAQNAAGRSEPSPPTGVETPEDRTPVEPSNLWAAPVGWDSVLLSWQDNASFESGFRIGIRQSLSFLTLPTTLPENTTRVKIVGLGHDRDYDFRLRSINTLGLSEWSNVATAHTFDYPQTCTVNRRRLCLGDGRFAVEVAFQLPEETTSRPATAVPATGETGFFWFFNKANVELQARLRGADGDGPIEFAFSGLSTLAFQVTVTDTVAGTVATYDHAAGEVCGGVDTGSFASVAPEPVARIDLRQLEDPDWTPVGRDQDLAKASPPCASGAEVLCLADGRFEVTAWRVDPADGSERPGQAIAGTGSTGYFYFDGLEDVEALVKILDGRRLNDRFWVIYNGLAEDEIRIHVTDRETGRERGYTRAAGDVCGGFDFASFSDQPE